MFVYQSLKRMIYASSEQLTTMLKSCESVGFLQWNEIKPHAENEFKSLLLTLSWLQEMKGKQNITTEQARIHIDIQKNTMRTRLMALPNVSMLDAEHIINTGIDSVRKSIYSNMDWLII
jgi:hypothetical protein